MSLCVSYDHLALDVHLGALAGFAGLLLGQSDVGVHQAACNTATRTDREHVRSMQSAAEAARQDKGDT